MRLQFSFEDRLGDIAERERRKREGAFVLTLVGQGTELGSRHRSHKTYMARLIGARAQLT